MIMNKENTMSAVDDLSDSIFAERLDDEELAAVAALAEAKTFYKNDKIFGEDDVSNSLFFLVEGKVAIERKIVGSRHLFVPQIQTVRHGHIFGEMAFLENMPRSATARAKSNVRVLVFQQDQLEKLMESNPVLGFKLMRNIAFILSRRLRRMNDQWLSAVGKDFVFPEFEFDF
jgi:CRP/FNR family cyclic AMP-dependent transcriptional regulator